MKKQFFTLLAILLADFLFAQSKDDLQRLEEFKRKVNAPVVLKIHAEEKISIKRDLNYNFRDTSGKRMDVYLHDDRKQKPLVILIHGKTPISTNPKNWGVYESWGKVLASEGFITVAFTHSLAIPGKTLQDAADDLEAAISFLKSQYKELRIDTTRIALVSYSAGSPLLNYPFIKRDKNIKALVSFYGFLNITETSLLGHLNVKDNARFSLINYIDTTRYSFPPFFIAQAGRENNQGLNQSINGFVTKASLNNIPITFYNHPVGVHGFDNQNNDARTVQILEAMIVFLHDYL